MAHFAQIINGKVSRVIVVSNNNLLNNGVESEQKGISFCKALLGQETEWVQTSYNANMRNKFAGIGDTWDVNRNAFISPQPFPSWVLSGTPLQWEAPSAYPTDGKKYSWNESKLEWVEI
jgi:hypothetical protein